MLLADMRKRVNDVDDEILRLLNKRATIVADIARMKFDAGLNARDAVREQEILERMFNRNPGPLDEIRLIDVFQGMLNAFHRWEVDKYVEWMHEKQNPLPAKVREGTAS